MHELGHHIRALVVLPVQELATQIAAVFRKYCTNTGLKVALLSGATPWHKEQQQILKYSKIFKLFLLDLSIKHHILFIKKNYLYS